jgi:hypothetical protein
MVSLGFNVNDSGNSQTSAKRHAELVSASIVQHSQSKKGKMHRETRSWRHGSGFSCGNAKLGIDVVGIRL